MSALPAARTYNQIHIPRRTPGGRRISIYWAWSYPWEAQRDPAAMYNRFSTMTEVRNVVVARLRNTRVRRRALPPGHRRHPGTFPPLRPGFPGSGRRSHRAPGRGLPADRPGRLQAPDRRADPRRHRHPDGLRPRPHARRNRKPRPKRSAPSGSGCNEKAPACCWPRITTSASPTISNNARSNTNTTATRWCPASSGSASTPAH